MYNSISFTSFRSHLAAKGAGLRLSTGVSSCGSDEASAGMCTLARCEHNATSNAAFGGAGPDLHLRAGRRCGGARSDVHTAGLSLDAVAGLD